jgi:hypothetical protein
VKTSNLSIIPFPPPSILYPILMLLFHIVFLRSVLRLLVTPNDVPSSPILGTLMMGAICSSETIVLTRITRPHIPEDVILHIHRRENLRPYKNIKLRHGATTPQ